MEVSQLLSDSSDSGRDSPASAESTPSPPRFTIDIYSDTICPWCYIGKKHLDRAIALYRQQNPDAEFSLSWKPFVLYPNAKVAATDRAFKQGHYTFHRRMINQPPEWRKKSPFISRLGPKAPAFFERLEKLGAPYGIQFEWEGTAGNSRDSHKLIHLAMDQDAAAAAAEQTGRHALPPAPGVSAAPGHMPSVFPAGNAPSLFDPRHPNPRQNATILALFRGMFEEGQDVSDRAFLVDLALQLGLADSPHAVLAWLDSPEADARIDSEFAQARAIGINGVPSFVVQGRYRVGGMQEPGIFLGLFDKIRARELGREVIVSEMAIDSDSMRRIS